MSIKEITSDGYTYAFEVREQLPDLNVSDEIIIREQFEEDVYEIDGIFGDNENVLDLGGNIGAFDIYAISKGAKKVFTFEPEPENMELLKKNIALNNLGDKIHTYELGVSDKEGEQYLYIWQGGSAVVGMGKSKELPMIKVKLVTFQQMVDMIEKDFGVTQFDCLKVDIEGSEYGIFDNVKKETMQKFKNLRFEFHDTSRKKLCDLIIKLNETHKVTIMGTYLTGGQIYANRY